MFAGIARKNLKKKTTLEAIRDSYFFVLLFLIHIMMVRLSPLILFLSMALGMLAATFMDIQNSVADRPRVRVYVNAAPSMQLQVL